MMTSSERFGPVPPFHEFYEALNGWPPFPWQARLADQVAKSGCWPTEIGVPTGLGKTACLDIAVWWLAGQAECPPAERKAPTRIWWLVNRRLLVDSTAEHAQKISETLADSPVDCLRVVGDRLRSIGASQGPSPLEVIRLRGGVAARRPTDPARPAIILSTIPMYGSRLLFRGYGTSRTMRPIDAALAGTDSLLLLDEAHLAPHLAGLISALADCTQGSKRILCKERSQPQLVALTATGNASERDRFDLSDDDDRNETVRQRLDAKKPLEIRVHPKHSVKHLAEAARDLLQRTNPSSCLVFTNTPDSARGVFAHLQKWFPESETILLTGRTREREAKSVREQILSRVDGMAADRSLAEPRTRHLIVVATQTLEVGADVDAEYLVTETCGVRALTQRLGRVNRLGRFEHARTVLVHMPPHGSTRRSGKGSHGWPVYGAEPEAVLARLTKARDSATGSVGLSPRVISEVLGVPRDKPGRAPEILNGLLWEWTKTTTPPLGEAPVEPYFSGISAADYSVSVIWRAHIPKEGQRLWPRCSADEVVAVPIREVRNALREAGDVQRLAADQITIESAQTRDLRPGDIIVLRSDQGLLDDFGWNPDATSLVFDMSILAKGLPLEEEAIERLGELSLKTPVTTASGPVELRRLLKIAVGDVPDSEATDDAERREAARWIRRGLREMTPSTWKQPDEWREFVADLDPSVESAPNEVHRLARVSAKKERPSDELDENSLAPSAVHLDRHGEAVGSMCRMISRQVGIASELSDVIERAGMWHDTGKADSRFQRWLDPTDRAAYDLNAPLLAKSNLPRSLWNAMRVAAGWPRGGRHEALSARLVQRSIRTSENGHDPDLAELLVHLVISHHGSGRPVVPPAADDASEKVVVEIKGVRLECSADLSVIDWDQPGRFRRLNERFGPWGLALMETILRQADHSVSRGMRMSSLEVRR